MTKKVSKKGAARRLMRSVPEGEKRFKILIDLTGPFGQSKEYDRAAAIIGASFLEYGLKHAIIFHLYPDEKDPEFNYLFEGDEAPYRELSGRARLAKAIGILSDDEFSQIEAIRHIRNLFAHTMVEIDFETPEVAAFFDDFKAQRLDESFSLLVKHFAGKDSLLGMLGGKRRMFVHALFLSFWQLITYPGLGMIEPLKQLQESLRQYHGRA